MTERKSTLLVTHHPDGQFTSIVAHRVGFSRFIPLKPTVASNVESNNTPLIHKRRLGRAERKKVYAAVAAVEDGTVKVRKPKILGVLPSLGLIPSEYRITRTVATKKGPKAYEVKNWEKGFNRWRKRQLRRTRKETERIVKEQKAPVLAHEQENYVRANGPRSKERRVAQAVANFYGGLVIGSAQRNAEEVVRPGKSQVHLERGLRGVFRRLEDGVGDPFNRIHGFFQNIIDSREALANRPGLGLFLNAIVAQSPFVNKLLNENIVNANKWTSRDKLASKIGVYLYSKAYTAVLSHKWLNHPGKVRGAIGFTGKMLFQHFAPHPTEIDEVTDRKTTQPDLLSLASFAEVLQTAPVNAMDAKFRRDLANGIVNVLTENRPLTDVAAKKVNQATQGVEKTMDGMVRRVTDNKVVNGVLAKLPNIFNVREKMQDWIGNIGSTQTGQSDLEKHADEMFNQSRNMLEYFQSVVADTPAMVRYPQAKPAEIERMVQAYEVAQQILTLHETANAIAKATASGRRTPAEDLK